MNPVAEPKYRRTGMKTFHAFTTPAATHRDLSVTQAVEHDDVTGWDYYDDCEACRIAGYEECIGHIPYVPTSVRISLEKV
jgi:hypothetical protein